MPWLVGTAFLHSVMIQERYGMLRVWNVFLMCLTFFMTIFGTFLTRAGLISSVHSFAKSDIGIYFLVAMLFLLVFCFSLIGWRTPELRAVHRIQSLVSREFAFLLNNWILLAIMFLVLVLTTFPLITELFMNEEVTMGPPVFNRFLVPFGIVLLVLSGVGPLIAWRKATGRNLVRAFTRPTLVALVVGVLHVTIGEALGFAWWVDTQPIYETATGDVLRGLFGASPVFASVACAFVIATIAQEFWRGTQVRMKNRKEAPFTALTRLVSKARRRYGGYIVHLGIVLSYVGFAGSCYDVEKEAALRPGETMEVGAEGLMRGTYVFRYERARTETDPNKTALYADLAVLDTEGNQLGEASPAKFIYRTAQEMATTEVAIRSRPVEDLYVILSTVDGQTQMATFRIIVRPLVMWIWIGGIVLILGTLIAMAPTVRELLGDGRGFKRTAASVLFAVLLVPWLSIGGAQAQDSSSLHAGHVSIEDDRERGLFERLLCMCGDCQRLSLATCGCGWADDMRAELRSRLAAGDEPSEIEVDYRERFGSQALSIPPDSGLTRAAWAIPVAGSLAAIGLVIGVGLAWRRRGRDEELPEDDEKPEGDAYDQAIDDELERMEGES